MTTCSLSDYSFSPQKIERRSQRVLEVGRDVANIYTKHQRKSDSDTDAFHYKTNRHDALIQLYFEKVKDFKWRHGFNPTSRINVPKIAALFIEAIIEENDRERLFHIPEECEGKDIDDVIVYEFIYAMICRTLEIRTAEVPIEQKIDLIMCIDQHSADTEWIAWGLHNFCKSYGEFLNFGD